MPGQRFAGVVELLAAADFGQVARDSCMQSSQTIVPLPFTASRFLSKSVPQSLHLAITYFIGPPRKPLRW